MEKNIHGLFCCKLAEVWIKNCPIEFGTAQRSLASKICLPRNSWNYAEDKFSRLAISGRSETQIWYFFGKLQLIRDRKARGCFSICGLYPFRNSSRNLRVAFSAHKNPTERSGNPISNIGNGVGRHLESFESNSECNLWIYVSWIVQLQSVSRDQVVPFPSLG